MASVSLCLIRRSRADRSGLPCDLSVARPMDIMRAKFPQRRAYSLRHGFSPPSQPSLTAAQRVVAVRSATRRASSRFVRCPASNFQTAADSFPLICPHTGAPVAFTDLQSFDPNRIAPPQPGHWRYRRWLQPFAPAGRIPDLGRRLDAAAAITGRDGRWARKWMRTCRRAVTKTGASASWSMGFGIMATGRSWTIRAAMPAPVWRAAPPASTCTPGSSSRRMRPSPRKARSRSAGRSWSRWKGRAFWPPPRRRIRVWTWGMPCIPRSSWAECRPRRIRRYRHDRAGHRGGPPCRRVRGGMAYARARATEL